MFGYNKAFSTGESAINSASDPGSALKANSSYRSGSHETRSQDSQPILSSLQLQCADPEAMKAQLRDQLHINFRPFNDYDDDDQLPSPSLQRTKIPCCSQWQEWIDLKQSFLPFSLAESHELHSYKLNSSTTNPLLDKSKTSFFSIKSPPALECLHRRVANRLVPA